MTRKRLNRRKARQRRKLTTDATILTDQKPLKETFLKHDLTSMPVRSFDFASSPPQ
jgi:hypothetical protein